MHWPPWIQTEHLSNKGDVSLLPSLYLARFASAQSRSVGLHATQQSRGSPTEHSSGAADSTGTSGSICTRRLRGGLLSSLRPAGCATCGRGAAGALTQCGAGSRGGDGAEGKPPGHRASFILRGWSSAGAGAGAADDGGCSAPNFPGSVGVLSGGPRGSHRASFLLRGRSSAGAGAGAADDGGGFAPNFPGSVEVLRDGPRRAAVDPRGAVGGGRLLDVDGRGLLCRPFRCGVRPDYVARRGPLPPRGDRRRGGGARSCAP